MPNAVKHKPLVFEMIQDSDSPASVWVASMGYMREITTHTNSQTWNLRGNSLTGWAARGRGVAEQVLFISRRLPCFKWIGRHGADYIQQPDKTLSSLSWVRVLHVGFLCVRVRSPRAEPLRLWLYGWLCSDIILRLYSQDTGSSHDISPQWQQWAAVSPYNSFTL